MRSRLATFVVGLVAVCTFAAGSVPPAKSNSARAAEPSDIRQIDLDGLKKLLRRDPKDTRPLLVNFWATWCDPCREEFPDLVKIDSDYRTKGLNFVAISLDDVTDIKTAVPQFL
ncbi:MAG TPA: TlpA disulfide reductase family protein, partial [Pyrinomonadaceae bacterium]|nr:TlpA disulfide reductase family protein [Pyrinomonadaceae bacterium]